MSGRGPSLLKVCGGSLMIFSGVCMWGNVASGTTLMHPLLAMIIAIFGAGVALMGYVKP